MGQRKEAIWRIVSLIWALTVAAILGGIVTLVGLVWMIVDVIWQLISGRNDLSETSRPARIVGNTLKWEVALLVFAFTGEGRFRWLPSSR